MPKQIRQTLWQRVGMFFYTKRSITALLFLVVSSFGIISYTTLMRREGFPSITIPIGVAQVISFGGSAVSVDATYAQPIIAEAKKNSKLKDISATSTDQGSSIVFSFEDGTNVKNELDAIKTGVIDALPKNAVVTFVPIDAGKFTNEGDDLLISVYGNEDLAALDKKAVRVAELVKQNVSLVKAVHVFPSFETVSDRTNGQQQSEQVRFDRYYSKTVGEFRRSVLVGVQGNTNVDQLKLADQVEEVLRSSSTTSEGITAHVSTSFAEGIREQVSSLQRNLIEGLAVVLVVSFILISLRASVATALSMTATVLITVGVLHLIGYTLNTITLFSLVLCLALIVDDTTIMVEAIDAGLKKGGKFKEVVSSAMRRVARASATGTLTTMLAFAPMLFIGGVLGKFIRAIPVTIIISLAVSLVVSFVFIPLIVRMTYGRSPKYGLRRLDIAGHLEESIAGTLAKVLMWSDTERKRRIGMRLLAIVIALVFLTGGGLLFQKVGFNIFPSPKNGTEITVTGQVKDRETATIETTTQTTDTAMSIVQKELGNDLEHATLYGQQGSASKDGFTATVGLSSMGDRKETSVQISERLQAKLNEKIPQMRFIVATVGAGPPTSSFGIDIAASDTTKAYRLAEDMKSFIEAVELKRLDGTTAGLENTSITPSVVVRRNDSGRIISLSADFSGKDTTALSNLAKDAVDKRFSETVLRDTYGLSEDAFTYNLGQEEENQDSFTSMQRAAGPLFLAMFIVMAILFKSLLQPLLILMALPFAIFGVANGLYWTKNEISFFTMLGVFALIGISLNNTILLTDYANQARSGARSASAAMASALKERLRPLLTTSVTSVFALLPLALNDPFWEGLAFTLIFGLISSTILVLLVFPYFYLINDSLSTILRKAYSRVVKTKRV